MSDSVVRRREITIYVWVVLLLLVAGFLCGWLAWPHFSEELMPQIKQLMKDIENKAGATWPHEMIRLFLHNAASATELVLFGFVLGLFPVYAIWINGLVIGFVVHLTQARGVVPWETIVYGLLPHGIFELTAILWAAALGVQNGLAVLRSARLFFERVLRPPSSQSTPAREPVMGAILRSARRLPIIWGILFVAAFVESAITPHIMAWGIPSLHH